MKLMLKFIKPYRKLMLFVLLVMVLDVAGGLLIPTITADIINKGIGGGNLPYIIRQGLLMLVIALITSFGALSGSYLCAVLSARLGRDIRNAVYDQSLKFSASDMESIGTGSMITRTLNDVNVIQQSVIMVAQMILPVPVGVCTGDRNGFPHRCGDGRNPDGSYDCHPAAGGAGSKESGAHV